MGQGRDGRSLAERGGMLLHQTVNVPPHVQPGPGPNYGETARHVDPKSGPCHVWVHAGEGRQPGLLVEWRKPDQLPWEGRVVRQRREGSRLVTVQEWLPATCIEVA